MNKYLPKKEISNIQILNNDFLQIKPTAKPFNEVEYILLDPSCSGSGMLREISHHTEEIRVLHQTCIKKINWKNIWGKLPVYYKKKIKGLCQFQYKILSFAMTFPKVNVIIYSTCSSFELENEKVIGKVLSENKQFEEVDLKGIISNSHMDFLSQVMSIYIFIHRKE